MLVSAYHFVFLEIQGAVNGFVGRGIVGVEETWRWEEDALSFLGILSCANVYFKAKPGEVDVYEGGSFFGVSRVFKDECTIVYIEHS